MWGVENGVVICSSSKDYELQSWNEQGETMKVEGMLTVAFSFIFSCSHRDRKELYLIIKIPYRVSMSTEQKIEPKKVELQPVNLLKAFHEQRDEIEKLKPKIDVLEEANAIYENKIAELESKLDVVVNQNKEQKKEIEQLKKGNHQLKIICGKADRGWRNELDWVFYYEPDTGEPIGYDCPRDFTYDRVTSIRYFLEGGKEWCRFWYRRRNSSYSNDFTMPKDAFLWLKGELPEQRKQKAIKTKIQKLEFKEKNDIIKHLEESNENIDDLEYLVASIDFLWNRKGKKFETHDFQRESKISSSSTVQIYLKMFVRCNIILKLKKGWYIVNIK